MRGTRTSQLALATAFAVVTAFAAAPASASIIADFTDSAWDAGTGLTSFTVGSVTAESQGGLLNFSQGYDGSDPCLPGLACDQDGGGIGDDEVTYDVATVSSSEVFYVYFASPQTVTQIDFLDLFAAPDGGQGPDELAQFNFYGAGGALLGGGTATGTDTGDTGWASWTGAFSGVTKMRFFADGTIGVTSPPNTDFAVAAIRTPEPGILGLMGVGLLGLGFAAVRRRA